MAEPLKNYFGPEVPARIADMIHNVDGAFPAKPSWSTRSTASRRWS